MLALQCGGSDGYSGITANPALGAAVDLLVRHGGTAILSETPEIYGAEHLLTRRAATPEVGEKLIERIHWWEDYTRAQRRRDEQQPLARQQGGRPDDHPGEIAGRGRQGRHHQPRRRLRYAEPVTAKGFVFMDTPGYDPVSATGQVAGGANMICFTTGRGSAYGCKPTPSIKLATNTPLYRAHERRHGHQLRRRARRRLDRARRGAEIFDMILAIASGERTKSRDARLRRRRIRALADRRDDVTATGAALLFDLDGTLIDSDAEHLAAFQRVFASYGIAVDRSCYNASIHGASNELIGRLFLQHISPEAQRAALDEKEAAYRADLAGVERVRGTVELLDFAERLGMGVAVVTNAPRANVDAVLSALGLAARLPIAVIGSELERSKPDPLPYLRALDLTQAAAGRSVAFEDSPTGVRSATAAGLAVVGMTSSLDGASLIEAGATFAAADFADPRIRALIEKRLAAATPASNGASTGGRRGLQLSAGAKSSR